MTLFLASKSFLITKIKHLHLLVVELIDKMSGIMLIVSAYFRCVRNAVFVTFA